MRPLFPGHGESVHYLLHLLHVHYSKVASKLNELLCLGQHITLLANRPLLLGHYELQLVELVFKGLQSLLDVERSIV
jgi:hypothetical protein